MASPKARKGAVAGALVGLAAVAAAVALTAAVPAPAPAEPAAPIVAGAAAGIRGAVVDSTETDRGPGESDTPGHSAQSPTGSADGSPDRTGESGSDRDFGSAPTVRQGGESEAATSPEGQQTETPASPAYAQKRRWVTDYKQVWVPDLVEVVDVPGHSEETHSTRDVLVCLSPGCGFTSSDGGQMAAHSGQHAARGEDDSSGSVSETYVSGTVWVEPVSHMEDRGHFETVEAGGHWE